MKYFIILILIITNLTLFAQSEEEEEEAYRSEVVDRARDLNIATGISNRGIPIHLDISLKIVPKFTAGVEAGVDLYRSKGLVGTGLNFGARGQFNLQDYFSFGNHIEPYLGASFGYEVWVHDFAYTNFPHVNGIRYSGFVGYKQFFMGNWAFHVEAHAGKYYGIQGGLTFRIY